MTFLGIKEEIAEDLSDAGISYSNTALNESLQDAYDDIAVQTKCIIKKSLALDWVANQSIYLGTSLASDFLQTIAIFDIGSNRFLSDDLTYRQVCLLDEKWQTKTGSPSNWFPFSPLHFGVFSKYASSSQTFDLYYSAQAPVVIDGNSPLVATDMIALFNFYVIADMLETYREFVKAAAFWGLYFEGVEEYRTRVKNFAKSNFLALI